MSLHAQLSPEAETRLRAQKRNSTISSFIIAILILVLIAMLLFFIAIKGLFLESPTIVTYNAPLEEEQEIDEKRVNDQVKRQPSAPSSSMAKVIASSTPSPTAIPVPEIEVPDPSADFGSGDDFGAGWGDGGDGGGGAFGNIPATMRKRCSRQDRLARLEANGGSEQCEDAVVLTLDWLQARQSNDGSWCSGNRAAMTGLALLTYLGHCETPLSEKYGETVTQAIVYLVDLANKQNGKLAEDLKEKHWPYEHAIATYAIAEAYTFCNQLGINIPGLHEATEKAGQWIIDNQSKSGSWDYSYAEGPEAGGRPSGGDNSIGCWHLQALKACKHTGIEYRNMRSCVNLALDFVENCQASSGGIGYASATISMTRVSTLAGAGALVFQMWDKSAHSVARKACDYVAKEWKFEYDAADCDLYALYYNAQGMINRGGEKWKAFNGMFLPQLLANQNKDGSWKDVGGNAQEINAVAPAFRGDNDLAIHYRTCLCALTLEVYYRFLPGTGQQTK
jgi:hypothetical protein